MIVTVSCLGNNGRFGNQLFQYAFAKAYAQSIDAELQTPDWIGRHIFKNINEKIMTNLAGPSTEFPNGEGNIDLSGYFQQPEHLNFLSRKELKEWFTFKDPSYNIPKYDVVLHKRRGDYLSFPEVFAIISDESYNVALINNKLDINSALVLDDSRPPYLLLHDFQVIMNCNKFFRSNSTFAWWASTLGDCETYSPVVKDYIGLVDVNFTMGNDEPLGAFTGSMKIND